MEKQGWPEQLLSISESLPSRSGLVDAQVPESSPNRNGAVDATVQEAAVPAAFAPPPRVEPAVSVTDDAHAAAHWDYSLTESEACLVLSLSLPEGVEPTDIDLDVGEHRVLASCRGANGNMATLTVELPRAVDAMQAPPAKYKKKGGRRLVLELPLM